MYGQTMKKCSELIFPQSKVQYSQVQSVYNFIEHHIANNKNRLYLTFP